MEAFETEFAALLGVRQRDRGRQRDRRAAAELRGGRLAPGDEVVVPSLTFAATAAAVVNAGATPVFADVRGDAGHGCRLRRWGRLGPRTRALITVSYAGHPGEAVTLRELADEHGLLLIEDAAHALGATVEGRFTGTIGDAGAFSFFANKNLPLGEGGMVVTDDAGLAERARLLRSHGLSSGYVGPPPRGEIDYDVLEPGFNFRLDEPRAALGLRLLARLPAETRRRAALAAHYTDELRSVAGVRPAIEFEPGVDSAWHIFPLLLDPPVDRSELRRRLREQGVQTSVHYCPLHLTRAFASTQTLPATENYASRTLTVPLFPHMTEAQQGHVLDALSAALRLATP